MDSILWPKISKGHQGIKWLTLITLIEKRIYNALHLDFSVLNRVQPGSEETWTVNLQKKKYML